MADKDKKWSRMAKHPSRNLEVREDGFGIAAGYEREYKSEEARAIPTSESYGPVPHSGYYGTGIGLRPFKVGQAGFDEEMRWYKKQYGDETGRASEVKRK